MNRRRFLASATGVLATQAYAGQSLLGLVKPDRHTPKPDISLRIEPCTIDIGNGVRIQTTAFNGAVPGPLLRLREGKPVTIDVTNASRTEDLTHWHGLAIPSLSDGAMEEGSPMIKPGATLRYSFTPKPAGTRWYHTHAMAGGDLSLGTYSGQFGFLLVEDGREKGDWDREVNLAIHHWTPHFVPMAETMRMQSANEPLTSGSDVGYKYATINGHMLGCGEPLRVNKGERILFRLLNASATENVILALPGHSFRVIALDGNPVPHPKTVSVLSLAVAERIDAIVEMDSPGAWVFGSTNAASREMGLGIVVEYANAHGAAVWKDPEPFTWDYSTFANGEKDEQEIANTFELTFRDIGPTKDSKFDTWTINNRSWPDIEPLQVRSGRRYRLIFRNGSGDQHPMHLHRHSFEVVQIGDKKLSGLMKDTVNVMPLESTTVEFVADNPGDSLLHCHQQLHMDYGFMQLIRYIE